MQKMKEELNKLKSMTFKEKIDHIWEYYRFQIIIFIGVLIIFYSIFDSLFIHPQKDIYVGAAFYGPFSVLDVVDEMETALTDVLVEDKDNYKVYITDLYLNETNLNYSSVAMQKFFAMSSAQEIDIIIVLESQLLQLANQGYLMDLSTLTDINFPVDDMYYYSTEDNPDVKRPFGISLAGSEFLINMGFIPDELYLAVMVNSPRLKETVNAINYITLPIK